MYAISPFYFRFHSSAYLHIVLCKKFLHQFNSRKMIMALSTFLESGCLACAYFYIITNWSLPFNFTSHCFCVESLSVWHVHVYDLAFMTHYITVSVTINIIAYFLGICVAWPLLLWQISSGPILPQQPVIKIISDSFLMCDPKMEPSNWNIWQCSCVAPDLCSLRSRIRSFLCTP